ncbi:LacI family DNA-binding transcriptional regulator [Streptomyces sp. KL116D]|uniref:LacI family DNA-binding transcriptional regulator n=1 Tax=Streptomyces sp. KL116D TaxID=3045152 RepID=UPI003557B67B
MAQSVGIKDVARAAGVSVGTVSNVINRPDTVADETRSPGRRGHRPARLRPQRIGAAAARGRSRIMGLLVSTPRATRSSWTSRAAPSAPRGTPGSA